MSSRRAGLTLMECVVAIGVFMLLATLALQFYIVTERAIGRQQASASREGDQRALLTALRRDARQARAVGAESEARHLVLLMPDGDRVEYRVAADHVSRRAGAAPEEAYPAGEPPSFVVSPGAASDCVTVRLAADRPALTLHLRNARGGL